jgi:hypothetical protein
MAERDEVVERLRAAGVLKGIRWAYVAACTRTLDDYSEDAGHDAAWLGCTRHTLFRDRLDRAFTCGRYILEEGAEPSAGLDLLHAQLAAPEIETWPDMATTRVQRADLNKSPGWAFEDIRFLLASSPYGEIDRLPWPQKSPTKQQVANQPNPEPPPTLFDEFAPDEIGGLLAALAGELLDRDTYVVAHSLDAVGGRSELVFGRPRINEGGGSAWHWSVDLLGEPPVEQGRRIEPPSPSGPPDTIPDAPVRLRQRDAAVKREARDNR